MNVRILPISQLEMRAAERKLHHATPERGSIARAASLLIDGIQIQLAVPNRHLRLTLLQADDAERPKGTPLPSLLRPGTTGPRSFCQLSVRRSNVAKQELDQT